MCTVTIVPTRLASIGTPSAVRLMTNRDESRRRAEAEPPEVHRAGERRALMPIDPSSGGTWVGVNDAGLVLSVLNANPGDMRGATFPGRASRGTLIPPLLEAGSFAQACQWAEELPADRYAPFRLVMSDGRQLAQLAGDGRGSRLDRRAVGAEPFMVTSSGLGDAVVEPPRRRLFETWFAEDSTTRAGRQEAFHRHHWPEHGEVSVRMSREDARTVSRTRVDLDLENGQAAIGYVTLDEQMRETRAPDRALSLQGASKTKQSS